MWTLVFVLVTVGAPEQRLPDMNFPTRKSCLIEQRKMVRQYSERLPDDVTIRTYCSDKPYTWTWRDIPELRRCWATQSCGGPTGDPEPSVTIKKDIYVYPYPRGYHGHY